MARRTKKIVLSDDWKAKIQSAKIMERLMGHVNGSLELSNTQVAAAKILLSKVIPDLSKTTHDGEVKHKFEPLVIKGIET